MITYNIFLVKNILNFYLILHNIYYTISQKYCQVKSIIVQIVKIVELLYRIFIIMSRSCKI